MVANAVKPKVLIAGYSSYAHHYDYKRMKEIADKNDSYLLTDMSHISGLVSAGLAPNPFDYSDVVMTTTHKTLGTVRNALIFYRKGVRRTTKAGDELYDLEQKINDSVFPGHFGGPHNHCIAGSAVGLKVVAHPLFKENQKQVAANAKVLCAEMAAKGYPIVGNGTSNHMAIVNVKAKGIDGARVDYFCSKVNISINKNVIPGGQNAVVPGGIRLGSPAMTTRGCLEKDFVRMADFLDRAIKLSLTFKQDKQTLAGYKQSVDEAMQSSGELQAFRREVQSFAGGFEFIY